MHWRKWAQEAMFAYKYKKYTFCTYICCDSKQLFKKLKYISTYHLPDPCTSKICIICGDMLIERKCSVFAYNLTNEIPLQQTNETNLCLWEKCVLRFDIITSIDMSPYLKKTRNCLLVWLKSVNSTIWNCLSIAAEEFCYTCIIK